MITSPVYKNAPSNKFILRLLNDGVCPWGTGQSLYFSYLYDITLTAQRTSVVAKDLSPAMQSSVGRADKQFFWNYAMSRPLIDAGAIRFVMPAVSQPIHRSSLLLPDLSHLNYRFMALSSSLQI